MVYLGPVMVEDGNQIGSGTNPSATVLEKWYNCIVLHLGHRENLSSIF
jgi:hypothetical protein